MPFTLPEIALSVVNQIPAMVAYWDYNQRCLFANDAYRDWLGKGQEEMAGISMQKLLGPIYNRNLPYILGALNGEKQVFESQILSREGMIRYRLVTYTPDVFEGKVRGFSAQVADVTLLREREIALQRALEERDAALVEVQTLRGLLPICACCKSIRDSSGEWRTMEQYVSEHTAATFTHGVCPSCMATHYGHLTSAEEPLI